ncbi:MAG TPA: triose-phosphate isomerase [Ktedonobacteraceae bacterium]|nr:triose-phosphate isomerase [Ktedonobacteraceae bacterium]
MTTHTRQAIVAGNWKMNFGPRQAATFATEIVPLLGALTEHYTQVLAVLCPPAISLPAVRQVLDANPFPRIELGAQNLYYQEKGAYTGELAPSMVAELCTTVIIGHSERRMYFHETDELVNQKVLAALKHGLRPIVCVGENEQQYDAGQTSEIVRSQVNKGLANLPQESLQQVVIAYEPIWAIGTGKAATMEQAGKVIQEIRETFATLHSNEAALALPILYGGSVTRENISEFMQHPEIDGALVGGASLKTDFVELLRQTIQAKI